MKGQEGEDMLTWNVAIWPAIFTFVLTWIVLNVFWIFLMQLILNIKCDNIYFGIILTIPIILMLQQTP